MSTSLSPDRLAALEEERDFLLRSLADLDAERAAGDIDDADHQALADDYTARTAEVIRAIDEHREAVAAARPPRSRSRLLLWVAGVAAVAVVAGILVAQSSGRREPGQTATGGSPQSPTAQARACIGQSAGTALKCFQGVLDDDPQNPTALTYLGWTLYQASQAASDLTEEARVEAATSARGLIDRAVGADPDFPDAYALRAIVRYREDGDVDGASADLDRLDDLDPPASITTLIGPIRTEIERAAREATTTTTTAPPP